MPSPVRRAIRFDATTDQLSRTTGLPPIATFTLMGWVYVVASRAGENPFLVFGSNSSVQYMLQESAGGGAFTLRFNGGNDVNGSSISLATWYHVAMVLEGTGTNQLRGYVNGLLDMTNNGHAATTAATMGSGVNGWGDSGSFRLAYFGAWNAPLTAAEIRRQMRFSYPVVRTGQLNSWYDCAHKGDLTSRGGDNRKLTAGGTLTTEDGSPAPRRRQRRAAAWLGASAGGGGGAAAPKNLTLLGVG